MRRVRGSIPGILAVLAFALASCAPAAPSPTAAPAKPTEAAAKPAAPAAPAAKPTDAPAAKPAEAKPAASPAAKPAEAKPAASPAAKAEAKPAAKPSGPPIKLGFIAPLTGPFGAYGALLKHAPAMVAQEVNDSGGINGSPLEIVTVDSPNNPQQSVTAVRQLSEQDKVFAIIGPYYSGEVEVAVPLSAQLKIPVITTTATKVGIIEPSEWAFRASIPDDLALPAVLDGYKKIYPNVKRMAIMGDAQLANTAAQIKDMWPKVLKDKGYEVIDTVTYQTSTTDFSPIVTRIKGANPDGVASSSLSPAFPNILKEFERQGGKPPIASATVLLTVPIFPKIAGPSADGVVVSLYFNGNRARDPRVKAWLDKYQELAAAGTQGEKPIIGYASEPPTYDVGNILVKIMRDAGITPSTPLAEAREKIRMGLLGIKSYPGIVGDLTTAPTRDILWPPTPHIARNSEWVPIE